MPLPVELPPWVLHLVWTGGTVAAAYALGHLIRVFARVRLTRLAARTPGDWDDVLVAEVARRVPFWSLLVGGYLSLGYWSLDPDLHRNIATALSALGVASGTFAASAVATRLVSAYGPRVEPATPVSALTQNVVRILVTVLGALVIIKSFGFDITPYLTALGVGGLAVALALQDPLSNFFAGVSMSVSGQIRIGDYVRLDSGAEGYVADFNWRATSIRMLANNVVIIPNAKLAQATVTNFHEPSRELAVELEVSVHAQSDLETVERVSLAVAREVMREVPGGVGAAEPLVRFGGFTSTGVVLKVVMRGREFADQFLLTHELIKRLHARYAREGIVIPFTPLDARATAALPAAGSE